MVITRPAVDCVRTTADQETERKQRNCDTDPVIVIQ